MVGQSFKKRYDSVQNDIEGQSHHGEEVSGSFEVSTRVQVGVPTKWRADGHFRGIQLHMLGS